MTQRRHGELWLNDGVWHLKLDPHVAIMAKRVFPKIPRGDHGEFTLTNTPEAAFELRWFAQRYPLRVLQPKLLDEFADAYVERVQRLEDIIGGKYQPPKRADLALPLRKYQQQYVDAFLSGGVPLCADDIGCGKSCEAIGCMVPETLPALVACHTHLTHQWEREIHKFAPHLTTHILQKIAPYELPQFMGRPPDVLISSYHKLDGWAQTLGNFINLIVLDEVQELRRCNSLKWKAAKHIAGRAEWRMGNSGTPIYNFGGEMFNVMDVIAPGRLGSREEFLNEWCDGNGQKPALKDPDAFGAWLVAEHLMMRRTRAEVGRELPALTRITHIVEADSAAVRSIEGKAGELAEILLAQTEAYRGEKMNASEQFSNVLRQSTGIAKAPYVAAFVKMLVEAGESVVLFGWHHAVYQCWMEQLKEHRPAFYTGKEPPSKKRAEIGRFLEGQTDLLIMSLRSGAGVDGLQHRCRTAVIGELDWSPAVTKQCIGRFHRDGQPDPVTAYFLISDSGIDPLMCEVLGLKDEQVEGIRTAGKRERRQLEQRVDSAAALRQLAAKYLKKKAG